MIHHFVIASPQRGRGNLRQGFLLKAHAKWPKTSQEIATSPFFEGLLAMTVLIRNL